MGKMIGSRSLYDGLYFLDSQIKQPSWLKYAYHITHTHDSMAIIWLWHRKLGHPSFTLLQHLFSSLFSQNNLSQFQCDTSELTKHH